jgi:hypothetical protein
MNVCALGKMTQPRVIKSGTVCSILMKPNPKSRPAGVALKWSPAQEKNSPSRQSFTWSSSLFSELRRTIPDQLPTYHSKQTTPLTLHFTPSLGNCPLILLELLHGLPYPFRNDVWWQMTSASDEAWYEHLLCEGWHMVECRIKHFRWCGWWWPQMNLYVRLHIVYIVERVSRYSSTFQKLIHVSSFVHKPVLHLWELR